jgi:hypothetical protein
MPGMTTCCFLWTGFRNGNGYGRIGVGGKMQLAPRVSWFLEHGRWPNPNALHRCDNPACVRPSHLFEGTQADNLADMTAKGRRRGGAPVGERNNLARLTVAAVREIKQALGKGASLRALGKKYDVAHSQISAIKLGKTWRHVTA